MINVIRAPERFNGQGYKGRSQAFSDNQQRDGRGRGINEKEVPETN